MKVQSVHTILAFLWTEPLRWFLEKGSDRSDRGQDQRWVEGTVDEALSLLREPLHRWRQTEVLRGQTFARLRLESHAGNREGSQSE